MKIMKPRNLNNDLGVRTYLYEVLLNKYLTRQQAEFIVLNSIFISKIRNTILEIKTINYFNSMYFLF